MKEYELDKELVTIDILTIFTLLVRCPSGGLPSSTCPFAPLRDKHSIEEKFHLAGTLPENKRLEMLAFHELCLTKAYLRANMLNQF